MISTGSEGAMELQVFELLGHYVHDGYQYFYTMLHGSC